MFHKHKFNKDGNNLWCKCGKVKRLECDHKWEEHNCENTIILDEDIELHQKRQIVVCIKCGEFKYINLNTGESKNL